MRPEKINAVILDWAGTTVDFGSLAPTHVFMEIFRRKGVEITVEEARGPMGRAKHEHIQMVASLERVSSIWNRVHGRIPNEADVAAMYEEFLPLQKEILAAGSDVIQGVPEAISALRELGLRIGSSTGYTRELMDVVIPLAAAQGYEPDVVVCSNEVTKGRPFPWMNCKVAELLSVSPLNSIVVVDDTLVGIEAGKQAGMITVGVTMTGNELGLSEAQMLALSPKELEVRRVAITERFQAVGADFVLSSVTELPGLINELNGQLTAG